MTTPGDSQIDSLADAPSVSKPEERGTGSLAELLRCESVLGYTFQRKELLRQALTHASGAAHRVASNERLEFLGDAVLGETICELLFERYPELLEGDLTKIKSVVVSRRTCAAISRLLKLDEFLIVGKGMSSSPVLPHSLLAGAFESVVAAIYLDGGRSAARAFIERFLAPEIEAAAHGNHGGNFKSLLQQYTQRHMAETPTYDLLEVRGPDHNKSFKVAARIGQCTYSPAWGRNKKEAEQRAALNAMSQLQGGVPPFSADEDCLSRCAAEDGKKAARRAGPAQRPPC
jgi:ribonuclease-3